MPLCWGNIILKGAIFSCFGASIFYEGNWFLYQSQVHLIDIIALISVKTSYFSSNTLTFWVFHFFKNHTFCSVYSCSSTPNHKNYNFVDCIGLKNSYFPLIHLPSCFQTICYQTVQWANHIQSCSLNQSITCKVVV